MIFLGTNRRHWVYWPLVVGCALSTKFTTFSELRITLDSIFTGLLALTGFVFTARTFITFKLNEVIYGDCQYREYVKKLQADGAYKKELYDPLKSIDEKLGFATYMCLCSTVMFIVVAFFPKITSGVDIGGGVKADYLCKVLSSIDNNVILLKSLIPSLICKIFTDATMVYFGFCLYQMVITVKSLHENISDIIAHWEGEYNKIKNKSPGISTENTD